MEAEIEAMKTQSGCGIKVYWISYMHTNTLDLDMNTAKTSSFNLHFDRRTPAGRRVVNKNESLI
ncbi:MAG: hypothetical protein Q7T59_02220, partial [Candidatus Woesebacteria bacterium]|nr:hypothetical protein [Candidatus Woesebacteria bacterium]